MFGLTISQEAALAAVALRRDELPTDLTDKGLSKQLLSLRDLGMLDMQTDWGGELAFVQRLLAEGLAITIGYVPQGGVLLPSRMMQTNYWICFTVRLKPQRKRIRLPL